MFWIFLALISYLFWSFVNIGDKYVIQNRVKNPYVYLAWLGQIGILTVLAIPFMDFSIPETSVLLWMLLGTALYFYGGLPYVKAVSLEDISRINIFWNLIPVFTLVLGWATIGDRLSLNQLLSFVILVLGATLASVHFRNRKISFSKAAWLMILATLAFSGYAVIFRHVSQLIPFSAAFVWNGIMAAMFSLTLFVSKKFRKNYFDDAKKLNKKTSGSVFGIAIFDNLGLLFNIWALSLGAAALVYALEGFQTIFVFILAILISIFKPSIFKEELGKANIIIKLAALVLIVIGVAILNLS